MRRKDLEEVNKRNWVIKSFICKFKNKANDFNKKILMNYN